MRRLAVVVVVALAGFAAAFVVFGDAARANCVLDASPDASYTAEFEEPVSAGDEPVVQVSRDGRRVTGAWVCATVAPTRLPGAAVAAEGHEVEPGRYALSLDLSAGSWSGTVLIGEEAGDADVAVPVTLEVAGGD